MHPFYVNAPPPVHPSYHQPQFMTATSNPPPAHTFDAMIKQRYTDSDRKLHDVISHSRFPNPESRQRCLDFVRYLRIYRYLFMHIYVHVVSCYRSGDLPMLENNANTWKQWNSVKQLTCHSQIRNELASFWEKHTCHQHKFLSDQRFVTTDDESDLLSHLMYCGRKPELYQLSNQLAIIIELLWQFLNKPQEDDVVRRLRAIIYRMSRKSAYLPSALQIEPASLTNRRALGTSGAHGAITKARMGGNDVAIKKIVCGGYDTQRKCLELFAGEAILWTTLRHKNIVPFLGVVMEGTFDMGLISPFYRNGNVRDHMKTYDPKEWPKLARRWGRDLAEGLAYIHSFEPPVIHGDIKGDNVLVDDDTHARLGDFGQSYASDSAKYLDSSRVGVASNPVYWMAPEIIHGGDHLKASDKSDMYSFGCVLYEMLSSKIPFQGCSSNDVIRYAREGVHPERPDSISSSNPVWRVAKSCWESPEYRPSATRVASLLH